MVAPSQPPELPALIDITSTTLTFTWQSPPIDSHNGVVRGYIVKLVDNKYNVHSLYNVTSTTLTISGLKPYNSYNISVSAYTVASGPYSEFISLLTNEAGMFIFIFSDNILT